MNNYPLKIKAVFFDRDGVIIDTDPVVISSAKESFRRLGFNMQSEDIEQIIGRSYTVYKDFFLSKWDFDFDEYRKVQNELFYENLDKAKVFPDTLNLIKYLYKKGIPMAVTTSSGKEGTLLILKKLGIDYMFQEIITRDDCTKLKPDPSLYLLTVKRMGIDPEYCVAVEDTSIGVEAAINAGIKCIAIPNGLTSGQDFSKANACLKSAKEMETVIEFF